MNARRLLIVEDDKALASVVSEELLRAGHEVHLANTGKAGLTLLDQEEPDLVLLDLGLPEVHGLAILDVIQSRYPRCRVCIMTAYTSLETKLAAFAGGSDDYLVKPFALAELMARVTALLRRGKISEKRFVMLGDICIYRGAPLVQCGDHQIQLAPMEHRLFLYLAERPGQVVSRSEALDEVWEGADRYPNTVDVHIESLRKKIEGPLGRRVIKTAYRQGYFCEP